MKIFKKMFYSLALCFMSLPITMQGIEQNLRAISFNVPMFHSSFFGWFFYLKKDDWNRLKLTVEMIQQFTPDVLGFQETQAPDIDDLMQMLGNYRPTSARHNTIIYRPDRLIVLDQGGFWLNPTGAINQTGWGSSHPRFCAWAKFRQIASNKEFYLYNTHLDLVRDARIEEAKFIAQDIQNRNKENIPAILMGDFNATTRSTSVYQLLHSPWNWTDSKSIAEHSINSSLGTYIPKNSQIDHILIKEKEDFKILQHAVVDFIRNGKQPSDHRPVVVDFLLQ